MPAVQTTYAATHAKWVEGMIPNMEPNVIVTRLAEDVEGIGFGKVCVQGTADNQVVIEHIVPELAIRGSTAR